MEMPSEDHQQPNDAERDSLARDLSARIYCLQPRHSVVCDSSIVSECFDSLLDQAAQVRSKPSSTRLQPKLSPGGSKSTSGLFRHEGSIISTSAASSSINGQRSLIKSESASTRDVAVSLGGERSMIVAGTNVNGSISTKGAKEKKTFLDSLKLPPEQLEALINDPGYFLYLSNASSSGLAYDLIVVEHSQINPDDYLTLSCSGMTHFSGFHSEFTPLRQWEREFGMFHRMREIPFFAKYRAWKMFTVWRKNVKRGKIKASMNALRSSLFVFIPSLRDALLKIQCLCQDTLCMTLINAQPGKTYELDEFERAQEQLLAERTSGLQVFTNDAQQLARAACDDVVDAFLKAAKIVADHRMTFMERASLRSECRKLTRFLRLVDFHVITTLRDLALESVDVAYKLAAPSSLPPRRILCDEEDRDVSFKSELDILDDEGEDTKLVPLLRVEVSYDERGVLKCSPSLSDVRNAFTNLLSQCLKAVGIPDRIFAHPDLALYVMSDSDDIPTGGDATGGSTGVSETSVSDLVAAELKYVNSSTQIQEALNSAFQEAMEYAEVFDPFYANSLENQTFHENISDIFGSGDNVDLLVYADAISKYRQQAEQFRNHLPRSADIGIFRVDSLVLKRMLVPSPLVCLDTLHARLPELMSDGFKELLDQLGEILPVVTGAPNNVPQFITKKHVVREALCKFESFKAAQHKLVEMSALMVKEGWVVPEDQKAHMVMVNENMSTLDTGLQIAEGREEDDTKRFAIEVSEEVPKIKKSIGEVRERLDSPIVSSIEEKPDNVIVFLGQQSDALATIRRRSDKLAEYQAELGQDVDEYDTLDEVSSDLDLKVRLWRGLKEWGVLTSSWVVTPLSDIDAVELETHVQTYVKTVHQASRGIPGNPVVPKLKESVDRFAPVLPVVKDLRNIALQERHWTAIHDLLGFEIKGDDAFTLGDVIDKGVTSHHKELTTISTNATQEAVLEEMMSKVSSLWESAEFEVKEYKDIKDLYILGDVSENIAALDESLVTVNTVLGSRYVSGIRPFVEKWRKDLILFQDTLDEWLACQRAWMYLESIFGSADIIRQLPAAAKQFQAVDKSWRTIMKATAEEPLALKSCCVKDRKETFVNHNATLDKIQKSLEQYLETKCAAFPRFYFLSSDELLSILSQSRDPQAVQPHMRKLFDNLVRLEFGSEPCSIDINGMYSGEGELVGLGKNLKARGQVEDWLSTVEQRMKHSLHLAMKTGLLDYEGRDRSEWVLDHPGQIVATVAQMMWARGTEKALSTADPADMTTWYQTNIDDLLGLIKQIRGDLPKLQRQKIVALVTTDVHARDIVEELITKKVSSRGDFTWMQQLRYYWERVDDTEDCVIRHSDALIHYGYEYMGCTSRLVITPLTDRCWLTLTGSYGLKLGAAPAGPAGTGMYGDCHVIIDYLSAGKTESSKDLAKAMAIQCVVFNCSDQIDYKMMGKLFRGLAQSGSWTCLDEFNRIDIEVLSVIAQQLLVLREGRIAKKSNINFMGVEIKLLDHHVIITMNPGYAGRTELPDNLQVCFRPVAMMVPNYALIAEIMLFAEGFGDAKTLSRKMCKLYILCSEQLSQQPHYDYGLRAVKSVLVMAGGLKRGHPDTPEDLVLIRALRDSNLPKFLAFDIPLFFAIIADLFPGVMVPSNDYGEFQTVMCEEINKAGLQNVPEFHAKVIQMFDVLNIRFGASLVGPTGSGKSTCFRILASTMSTLSKQSTNPQFQEVKFEILNPKAITMGELYGEVNPVTQEWKDGLASTIMRRAVEDESEVRKWTVFDGPVDAIWIENMNTVLDDNQTLCLANGERIKLKSIMRILFEVQDLAAASPATVSRIGVVFLTPSDLGWMPFIQSWSQKLPKIVPEAARTRAVSLFEKFFQPALDYQRKHLTEPIGCVEIQQAASCATLISAMLAKCGDFKEYNRNSDQLFRLVDKIWFFAYTWSIGGSITDFDKFTEFTRGMVEGSGIDFPFPETSLYDCFVSFDVASLGGAFVPWKSIVPTFEFDQSKAYTSIVVPTEDTTRFSYLMRTLIAESKPCFLTGVTGTGKTLITNSTLKLLEPPVEDGGLGVLPVCMNFSAQTSSLVTQASIEAKLEKKRKNLLGAPAGRKVVVFVDDVNMPTLETYGAQPPVELLRQFLDFKGFYDRSKLFWKDITDMLLFAASAPPGGGRSELTPRFVRHFNVLCVPPASEHSMSLIFESIFGGFMAPFDKDLQDSVGGVVAATIEVYNQIATELLPTPSKFHYSFNLRDLSKVFQGLLMITASKMKDRETLAKLWLHETQRVFYDRLINSEDQLWFENLGASLVQRLAPTLPSDLFGETSIIFADFGRQSAERENRKYELVELTPITNVLTDMLDDYNVSFPTKMNLVFFSDAVRHVCRMCRILRQPRGNAMLVGVGGSGKQSTARLAAFVSGMQCRSIEINRGYGIREFREDMKKFMITTGVDGSDLVFLLTDSQVVCESMLEDINSVLNSGEIPNLFPQDELDKICSDMIPVCDKLGIAASRDNCVATFVRRVWDKLHIVLCMSPVGDALRVRCRQFPSLISCATIDWYLGWPESALEDVARHFVGSVNLGSGSEELEAVHKDGIVNLCVKVHLSIEATSDEFFAKLRRRTYTTPKSYLDLINMYSTKLSELQARVDVKIDQMTVGTRKLTETNAIVDGLRDDLKQLEPVLVEKKSVAEKMLKQVAIDQADADVQKEKVSAEEATLKKQSQEVAAVAAEAQADLDVALPALNAAVKALDSLTKNDITEVKAFKNPPAAVKVTMEGICIMLERKPDWDEAKKVLGETDFLNKLKSYDKDNIKESVVKKIQKYIIDPNMQVDVVTKVSQAAKGLCMWIHAMNVYHKVAKEVAPKQARVDAMNRQLTEANATLKEKQDALQAVLDKVATLQQQCDNTVAEKQELEEAQEQTAIRLANAEKLTSGLSSEGVRWKANLEIFASQRITLIGDTLLACAAISYYGPFTGEYRDALVNTWIDEARSRELPCSEHPTLMNTVGDPVKVREWQTQSLPTDDVSTANALLCTESQRWPLCIDPQMQANKWIKKMHEHDGLLVTKMSDVNILRVVEQAVRNGKPLLVEDVQETLIPALQPVLSRATFSEGGRLLIRLGDSNIDYDNHFKLYLTSKLANPHYMPEVCILATVINFATTFPGLEDQLLGEVVRSEKPDIEKKSVSLLLSISSDRKKISEIEALILKKLSESTGNILDDVELITTLAESKDVSQMVEERLAAAEQTRAEISQIREEYRPVATRGSVLYFVIADMAQIDPMYQFSLQYFQSLFNVCLRDTEAPRDQVEDRINALIAYSTQTIYANVCRGLFERHKVLFSGLLAFSILRHANKIGADEWNLLLRGSGMPDRASQPKNPYPEKITGLSWDLLCAMENLYSVTDGEANKEARSASKFAGLTESISTNLESWSSWLESEDPQAADLPLPFKDSVSSFGKLLVCKALRDEKTLTAISTFVRSEFGDKLADSPSATMEEVLLDLDNATPCIFILSKGSDPTALVLKAAKNCDYQDRLHLVSLGQGQGPAAKSLVDKASRSGDWVLLQNCMLAKSWLPSLEIMVTELEEARETNSPDFRLFLTSSPATYFPVAVLQRSVKMTNEPPQGLRANLLRSYANLVPEELFEGNKKSEAFKRLLCGLCFFHANIQERRKFGPLGWNIRYAFDESDLETSIAMLDRFLNEQSEIPFDALRFVVGHINYGGRVTDDWDRRCLLSILGIYFNEAVMSEEEYAYSESGKYRPAGVGLLQSHVDYFESLPRVDEPEFFGMHQNAYSAFLRAESTTLLTLMLQLQPRLTSGSGSGKTSDEIVLEMIADMQAKHPGILDEDDAGKSTFVIQPNGLLASLDTVLKQEIVKFNRLLSKMTSSLVDLHKAINGFIVLSSDLDQMYTAFMQNALPAIWNLVSFSSLKTLGSWVKDVIFRVDFMRTWLLQGLPASFPLPVFFFPQGFMTGTLQTFARKYQVAIDTLQFEYAVISQELPLNGPEDGVFISSLYMEGARWDFEARLLKESRVGEMFVNMPVLHFKPSVGHTIPDGWYACPVYKTAERKGVLSTTGMSTNFVVAIELPSSTDPRAWVLAGVVSNAEFS